VTQADTPRRVLVAEDEANIRELVRLHLGLEGWDVLESATGQDALDRLRAEPVDLVVLDIMLPGLDGITVLRAMRRGGPNAGTPVLLLTARREESDKVLGLDSGADDYLTKPFGVRELVARARALMRRVRPAADATSPGADQPVVTLGPVTIDPARRLASLDNAAIELTGREFDLLYLLASHPGIVFSREALIARVWKGDTHVTERSVDTLVKRLRRKIERDPANPDWLLTVWGTGYKAADV
jgi:two-component system OmpR family response regulator/two-component system alkaline phosphatase synthesis response regulator PhoP